MQSFVVPDANPADFVRRVQHEIQSRDFGAIASAQLAGDRLEVRFSYVGTSVLAYRLSDQGGGFRAELVEQRMSPFHAPFRAGFEERFDQVLQRLGAHRD